MATTSILHAYCCPDCESKLITACWFTGNFKTFKDANSCEANCKIEEEEEEEEEEEKKEEVATAASLHAYCCSNNCKESQLLPLCFLNSNESVWSRKRYQTFPNQNSCEANCKIEKEEWYYCVTDWVKNNNQVLKDYGVGDCAPITEFEETIQNSVLQALGKDACEKSCKKSAPQSLPFKLINVTDI